LAIADILLSVVPTLDDEPERLAVAVDLACRLHARLNGVYRLDGDGRPEWARALFERALARSPVDASWRAIDGRSGGGFLQLARRSDVCILPSASAGGAPSVRFREVVFESGRPVLFLPSPRDATSIASRVMVAWSDTPASARAMHEALPVLAEAQEVRVLTVQTRDEPAPLADTRLLDHLRQHGVAAHLDHRSGEDIAEEIAAEVRRWGADMLVIGVRRESDRAGALSEISQRFLGVGSLPVFCSS